MYRVLATVFLCPVFLALFSSCNTVGPKAVRGARINYNEAIARTGDQQLLLNLVRLKYRDTPLFLEITSVSTQYNLEWSAGASQSFTDTDTLTGGVGAVAEAVAANTLTGKGTRSGSLTRNRVDTDSSGMDVGLGFYERPTITYSPLQGEDFVTQLLSPIPLERLMLLSGSGWSTARILQTCLQEMNGLDNASSASGPTPELAPSYEKFRDAANLLRRLQIRGALEFVQRVDGESGAAHLELHIRESAKGSEDVIALRRALHLSDDVMQFIVAQTTSRGQGVVLALRPRSLMGVLHFLSQGVEAPADHAERGLVTTTLRDDGTVFDWADITGGLFRVQSQNSPPSDAFVRVRYRGRWFFIEDTDLESKTTFGLLTTLFKLQSGNVQSVGPALTLPVG
jgi:hypothetical protein